MADQFRYQQTGIGYAQQPVSPGVDPVAGRTAMAAMGRIAERTAQEGQMSARMTGDITQLLDRMASSLYKDAVEEAQRAGMQWGAQNPVGVDQLQAAVAMGDDPLATRHTYFGEAARKVQSTILGNQMQAESVNAMARIQAEAELGMIPLSAAAEKMNALADGFSQTLMQVDPETGVKLKAAITSHASSVYKHLAGEETKRVQALQKAAIDNGMNQLPKVLETVFANGDQLDPNTGVVIPTETIIAPYRAMALQAARVTGDPRYADEFQKMVDAAKVNSAVAIASKPEFAGSTTGALSRMNSGDLGPMSGVWAGMTTEQQTKAKENFMRLRASEYQAQEREEKEQREDTKKQMAQLVTDFYLSNDPKKQRDIGRRIAILNATSPGGPVYEPGTIKAFTKPEGDDPDQSTAKFNALRMIDRQGVTDINEIVRRTGVKGKELVSVQQHLYSRGERELNNEIKNMAGIPDGIVQMDGDQKRRFERLTRAAETIKAQQIAEKGEWNPATVVQALRQNRDDYTKEKQANDAKARLAAYAINGKTYPLTPDTSVDEMRKMKIPEPYIDQITKLQAQAR